MVYMVLIFTIIIFVYRHIQDNERNFFIHTYIYMVVGQCVKGQSIEGQNIEGPSVERTKCRTDNVSKGKSVERTKIEEKEREVMHDF